MIDQLMAIQHIAAKATSREAMWVEIIRLTAVADIAEVGVYAGAFAENLLRDCESLQNYTMIDPWKQLPNWHKPANQSDSFFEDLFQQTMQRTAFAKHKITVLRNQTKAAAEKIRAESLDMAYIDGDHTLRGITIDLMLMWDKVKTGGMVAGDDFTKSVWQHGPKYDPTFVCPYAIYFAEAMNVPIITLPFMQFLILKDSSLGFELIHFTEGYENLRINKLMQMPDRFK